MIDINDVEWYDDGITRRFIKRMGDKLTDPEHMTVNDLTLTITYIEDFDNPYSREMMRRSGHLEKFVNTYDRNKQYEIFERSGRYHGISFI